MMNYRGILNFYNGKRILITGNTGFKGSWLTYLLLSAGARVTGYGLAPFAGQQALFYILRLETEGALRQVYGDIRDLKSLMACFFESNPEIVIHMAAQPIVRESYKDPVNTYATNVMGTVNVCEAVRQTSSVRSFLNVTTDKVYKNREWEYGYRESDELNGRDPYSNSKSCSELVTRCYNDSFFVNAIERDGSPKVRVSTARAGNVIGGGDFSPDRIVPDCVRAIFGNSVINVRNPYSTRPYQHVLEPLFVYMMIAAKQFDDASFAGCYNVGPDDVDCVSTGELVTLFCDIWNSLLVNVDETKALSWNSFVEKKAPHEASFLKLDCSKLKAKFNWRPRWHLVDAVRETVNWTKAWMGSKCADDTEVIRAEMDREIKSFIECR